jgi:nitrate reductase gamma subunit
MDLWIDIARGPLFRVALAIMILGLGYRIVVAVLQITTAWRRASDRRLPGLDIAAATLGWLVPVRLLRSRPAYSVASFVFHVGVIAVPFFLAGHVALLPGILPRDWPTLSPSLADLLTLSCLTALAALMVGRLAVRPARKLSRTQDIVILVVLLLTVLFGYLAAHPTQSPLNARSMLLLHILGGNLVLVLIPTTKIAHCVLYPFTQLLFQLGWHFPADTGRHVAIALAKENEPI